MVKHVGEACEGGVVSIAHAAARVIRQMQRQRTVGAEQAKHVLLEARRHIAFGRHEAMDR